MFKITREAENTQCRVSLHGHFTGEYIPEVEKALSQNGCKRGQRALDLKNVTFVDRVAMEFLCKAKANEIRIENAPSYVTRWMDQEVS